MKEGLILNCEFIIIVIVVFVFLFRMIVDGLFLFIKDNVVKDVEKGVDLIEGVVGKDL